MEFWHKFISTYFLISTLILWLYVIISPKEHLRKWYVVIVWLFSPIILALVILFCLWALITAFFQTELLPEPKEEE